MLHYFLLALGGAIGTLLRYLLSGLAQNLGNGSFPIGTLSVNLIGSLAIGLLWGVSERYVIGPDTKTFIFIGLLGGFTTFSTYSFESLNLIRNSELKFAALNVLLNNILGIALVFLGLFLAKYFLEPK